MPWGECVRLVQAPARCMCVFNRINRKIMHGVSQQLRSPHITLLDPSTLAQNEPLRLPVLKSMWQSRACIHLLFVNSVSQPYLHFLLSSHDNLRVACQLRRALTISRDASYELSMLHAAQTVPQYAASHLSQELPPASHPLTQSPRPRSPRSVATDVSPNANSSA